jgi:hypothetical protein
MVKFIRKVDLLPNVHEDQQHRANQTWIVNAKILARYYDLST